MSTEDSEEPGLRFTDGDTEPTVETKTPEPDVKSKSKSKSKKPCEFCGDSGWAGKVVCGCKAGKRAKADQVARVKIVSARTKAIVRVRAAHKAAGPKPSKKLAAEVVAANKAATAASSKLVAFDRDFRAKARGSAK